MEKIIVNPKICHGKPTIKGTRIMVSNILGLLAGGYTLQGILDHYPELTPQDIKESIEYAVKVIQEEEIVLP